MWIKTEDGGALDSFKFVGLGLAKKLKTNEDTKHYVYALTVGGYSFTLKTFDNKEDAKKCVEELVHALNGDEKVGYSFSWLKNEPPAETEKPVDNNPSLIDGIAL